MRGSLEYVGKLAHVPDAVSVKQTRCPTPHPHPWRTQLWAPDAAYVNGTYYLIYCAIERATNMFRTGLAISEQPQGPFTDIGFVQGVEWGQDPALYIDHDQTPYLYWGCGGRVLMAQLQPDLRAIVPGTLKELTETVTNFYEGAWVFDRNGVYYMMYAGQDEGTWGETLEYATAPHPTGPWAYGGVDFGGWCWERISQKGGVGEICSCIV